MLWATGTSSAPGASHEGSDEQRETAVSHLTQLIAEARKSSRHPSKPQPYDGISKAELWERLQAAEAALSAAKRDAQTTATMAHNYAQSATGETRRQFIELRGAAYKARDTATC